MEYKNTTIKKLNIENENSFSVSGKFNKQKSLKSLWGFELKN